jgi:hypothetical protein
LRSLKLLSGATELADAKEDSKKDTKVS